MYAVEGAVESPEELVRHAPPAQALAAFRVGPRNQRDRVSCTGESEAPSSQATIAGPGRPDRAREPTAWVPRGSKGAGRVQPS